MSRNSSRGTQSGRAIGQTFYAFDTLITRITVWRPPNSLSWTTNRLFVTTVDTVNYDPPKPITQGILQDGPAVFVRDSDPPGLPIRMDFVLDPPLALPGPGTYAFFVQREGCDPGNTIIMAKEPGAYPYGTFWITGRTLFLPCYLARVDGWEDLDLCFEVEYQRPVAAIELALASAEAGPCAARLAWSAGVGGLLTTLYRRTPEREWGSLGRLVADSSGRLAYEDRGVLPGARYGYRLGVKRPCGPEVFSGETWVDIPAAPRLVLESARAETCQPSCRVELVWSNAGRPVDSATVWRRTVDRDWSLIAAMAADSGGRFRYQDTQVSPGVRYGYRAGAMGCARAEYFPEIWVEVPVAELALAGVRPNPAGDDLSVAFALRDASAARLELIDIAGRRVAVREVGALGRGHHVVHLPEARKLRAGVYLVRLTQGGRSLTTRAALVR